MKYFLLVFLLFSINLFAQTALTLGVDFGRYRPKIDIREDSGGDILKHDEEELTASWDFYGVYSKLTFKNKFGIGLQLHQRGGVHYSASGAGSYYQLRDLSLFGFYNQNLHKRFFWQTQAGFTNIRNLDFRGNDLRISKRDNSNQGSKLYFESLRPNTSALMIAAMIGYKITETIRLNFRVQHLSSFAPLERIRIFYHLDLPNSHMADTYSTGGGLFYQVSLSFKVLEQEAKP